MPIDLFGFTIGRNGKMTPKPTSGADSKAASFVGPDDYDGTFTVEGGCGKLIGKKAYLVWTRKKNTLML